MGEWENGSGVRSAGCGVRGAGCGVSGSVLGGGRLPLAGVVEGCGGIRRAGGFACKPGLPGKAGEDENEEGEGHGGGSK